MPAQTQNVSFTGAQSGFRRIAEKFWQIAGKVLIVKGLYELSEKYGPKLVKILRKHNAKCVDSNGRPIDLTQNTLQIAKEPSHTGNRALDQYNELRRRNRE